MWRCNDPVTVTMLHKPIYDELRRIAKLEQTTTYSAIAPLAGLDMENPAHREEMRQILGKISTYEHNQGRPMLSAVVVYKRGGGPGPGFYECARNLGLLSVGSDETAFFCQEVTRVFAAWK